MSAIRTNAAAALLGVSANTLRSWEGRYGYPKPRRTEGGHRQYELAEIETLRQTYAETGNISSAISLARERGEGPSTPARLRTAFAAFSEERADRLLEESMALRSVERTIETLLLPAVAALAPGDSALTRETTTRDTTTRETTTRDITTRDATTRDATTHSTTRSPTSDSPTWCDRQALSGGENADAGVGGPEYCFAWRYATGWLAAAQRVAPAATRDEGVLIFDSSQSMDIDGLYVQALELFLRRAGLRVLTLPVELDSTRVGSALRALRPRAMVLGGHCASLDTVGRVVYASRRSGGDLQVFDYRGALPDTGASTVVRLGPGPADAAQTLREWLAGPSGTTAIAASARQAPASAAAS